MMSDNDITRRPDRSHDISRPLEQLHVNERIKQDAMHLRGTIMNSLADAVTGAVSENDNKLLKFHGIYQQDHRDIRDERRRQKLEPAYMFMIRVRLPGGVCSPDQLLQLIELSEKYGNGTLRLTTRQTFQLHEVLKHHLKPLIQGLKSVGLDTIAACGDDTRGVMCAVDAGESTLHTEVYGLARQISRRFIPRTGAYGQIWLDTDTPYRPDEEPLYGRTYLPRKFKIGLVVPPRNDIDVYAQDMGLIAVCEDGHLLGFNVCVGGGMGHTDSNANTYPRLATVIGYLDKSRVFDAIAATISIQRDFGDRVDRLQARFKYTLDKHGLDWFIAEFEARAGFPLAAARPVEFTTNADTPGWYETSGGLNCTLFIENGRISDQGTVRLKQALRELANIHPAGFRLTPNQNLSIVNIKPADRPAIEKVLRNNGITSITGSSALRHHAMACVAFPTCGLAMSESERYLPGLLSQLESILQKHGLDEEPITLRMSGCPNGCSRPYISEIGLTGRAPGKYNMYIGGARNGARLNRLYRENINEQAIIESLDELFSHYARDRLEKETFGDYVVRAGFVRAVTSGIDFKQDNRQEVSA